MGEEDCYVTPTLILSFRADCQDCTEPSHNIGPRILGTNQCGALAIYEVVVVLPFCSI